MHGAYEARIDAGAGGYFSGDSLLPVTSSRETEPLRSALLVTAKDRSTSVTVIHSDAYDLGQSK